MENRSNLARLLRPHSIAVVGGGVWCKSVVEQCQKIGFEGPVWPVHPYKKTIAGLPVFSQPNELPAAPDAVFIGVNRHALIETLPELNALGAGGAVCFASGFMETGESSLHQKLLKAAGDMALLGPNCYGFINYLDRCALWPDQHGGEVVERGVAIITQSSNIALNITMQRRGLPVAYMVTAGNQAQTGLAEIGEELLNDDRVTALGCHIEGFGDLRAYEALAKKAYGLGKPVIILKVGRSKQARAASISHTASLAGDDAGAQAFIDRLGFARVENLPQFLEMLKLVHVHGRLGGTRVASLSCSGGEASLVADAGHIHGISFPKLTASRKKRLDNSLGELVSLANPLDYHTDIWRDRTVMGEVFAAMSGPDIDLTIVLLDFPQTDNCRDEDWIIAIEAVEDAAAQTGRPFGVVASLPENMPDIYAKRLTENNIVPLCAIDDALAAMVGASCVLRKPAAEPVLLANSSTDIEVISEHAAKIELAEFGLYIPVSARAGTVSEVAKATEQLPFPVVLKGEGFAHKSEAGAVVLDLKDKQAVCNAAQKMNADSFLVEEQITDVVAELLIGVTHDPAHGFLLTLAAGGVLTELLQDSQTLLVPATKDEIGVALDSLKCAVLLKGYRGKPAANHSEIVDAVLAVQNYVISNAGKISEVEINPLMCTPKNAIAADALISREK